MPWLVRIAAVLLSLAVSQINDAAHVRLAVAKLQRSGETPQHELLTVEMSNRNGL